METNRSKRRLWNIALLALFVCSYFAVRARVINTPLFFEEGIFAELIVNRPCGPLYNMGGHINGEKFYGYFQHPAPSYELLRGAGWLAQSQLTPVYSNDDAITPRLRILCSLFQLTLWLALAAVLCLSKSFSGKWPWIILFVVAMSPLAIKSSTSLQTDNTAGVFLCGVASVLFMLAAKNIIPPKIRGVAIFLAAFIAGLGKQEWSFVLLAAAIALPFLAKLLKLEMPFKKVCSVCLLIIGGLIAANLASFSYDPINYTKGFEIMARFSKVTEVSASQWDMGHWLWLSKLRAFYIFVCFALALFFVLSAIANKNQSLLGYLLFLYGGFLFAGYVLSDWNDEVRYFAPSLAVLTVACITASPRSFSPLQNKIALSAFLVVGVSTVFFLVLYVPHRNLHLERIKDGSLRSTPDTVLYIDSGAAWNKLQINYRNNNSDFEMTQKDIKLRYGKTLVKPD